MVINATTVYVSISGDKWPQLKMQAQHSFAYKVEGPHTQEAWQHPAVFIGCQEMNSRESQTSAGPSQLKEKSKQKNSQSSPISSFCSEWDRINSHLST